MSKPRPAWLPPLPLACMAVTFAALIVFNGLVWFQWATGPNPINDFEEFYVGALLARAHGVPATYDLAQFNAGLTGLGKGQWNELVVVTPLQFWTIMPLTALPLWVAYWTWTVLTVVCAVLAWKLIARGSRWERVVQLMAFWGIFPVGFELLLGQFTFITCLALAAALALIERRRNGWAGAI